MSVPAQALLCTPSSQHCRAVMGDHWLVCGRSVPVLMLTRMNISQGPQGCRH